MSNSDQSHEAHADGIVEAGHKAPIYFYLLFFGLIAWGVIFMAYYLFSGWSSGSEFEEKMAAHNAAYNAAEAAPAADNTAAENSIDAAALFSSYCSGCHGADGKGGFGSDLSKSSYKYGKDAAAVKVSIAEGRGGGKMPSFGGQLSAAEVDALVEYSRNL